MLLLLRKLLELQRLVLGILVGLLLLLLLGVLWEGAPLGEGGGALRGQGHGEVAAALLPGLQLEVDGGPAGGGGGCLAGEVPQLLLRGRLRLIPGELLVLLELEPCRPAAGVVDDRVLRGLEGLVHEGLHRRRGHHLLPVGGGLSEAEVGHVLHGPRLRGVLGYPGR